MGDSSDVQGLYLTRLILSAIQIPRPMPAMANAYAKTCAPACTQIVPGTESKRMVRAPSGKNMTNARPMVTPCAIRMRRPKANSAAVGPPYEDPLLALGPVLAPDTAAVGAVPPAAVAVALGSVKGFREFPPAALVRSKLKAPWVEWIARLALWSLVFRASPPLTAQIQLEDGERKSIDPPSQELQFEPRSALEESKGANDSRTKTYSERWRSSRHWRLHCPPAVKLGHGHCSEAQCILCLTVVRG